MTWTMLSRALAYRTTHRLLLVTRKTGSYFRDPKIVCDRCRSTLANIHRHELYRNQVNVNYARLCGSALRLQEEVDDEKSSKRQVASLEETDEVPKRSRKRIKECQPGAESEETKITRKVKRKKTKEEESEDGCMDVKENLETIVTEGTSVDASVGTRTRKKKAKAGESEAEVLPKKKKKKRVDRNKPPIELLAPAFPFEGESHTTMDPTEQDESSSSNGTHLQEKLSFERVDSVEGRFYSLNSSSPDMQVTFPSVTTILSGTNNSYALKIWRKNMLKEHGEEKFTEISQETLRSGSNFHKDIETMLSKGLVADELVSKDIELSSDPQEDSVVIPTEDKECDTEEEQPHSDSKVTTSGLSSNKFSEGGYIQSVQHVLSDIEEIVALENAVAHFELGYMGTFDCLAKYKGDLCLIDWKTSSKPKPTLSSCYDYPLQAVAYAGAINQDQRYSFKVRSVLLVIAYLNGDSAHAHFIPLDKCQQYWLKWLLRLQEYQTEFATDLSEICFNDYN